MRKYIVILMITLIAMGVVDAFANGKPAFRTCPYTYAPVPLITRAYSEGFEWAFPPTDWTLDITNAAYTWSQYDGTAYEGMYSATIFYDPSLTPQNEWLLFDHKVTSLEYLLHFWTMGSAYWCANGIGNPDFVVTIDDEQVYSFCDDPTIQNWVWQPIEIDLSTYIDSMNQTIEIGFGYTGYDGAQQSLDAIVIDDEPYDSQPPENDECSGSLPLNCGDVYYSGTTYQANNTYSPGGYGNPCTSYDATGGDVTYSLFLLGSATFNLTYSASFDNSFYIVTDCDDPSGTCLYGMDDDYTEYVERMTGALGPGLYYLILDSYSGSGNFTLTGTIHCGTSTQESSWGEVKKQFR